MTDQMPQANIAPRAAPVFEEPPEEPPKPIILPTAYDIFTAEYPDPVWIVPGYIPSGFTILAGRPKLGKSWLALQIAQAVDTGGRIFDQVITAGPVLYLALEDSRRRLQNRMKTQGWTPTPTTRANILCFDDFREKIGFLNKGGTARLQGLIEVNGYRFIVIDTMIRSFIGIKDFNNSAEVTEALAPIQEMANRLDLGVLGIDHHNKVSFSQDPIDDVMSSTAKSAIADTVLGIYTEQGKRGATLKGRGRDLENIDKRMIFDKLTGAWQIEGDSDEIRISEQQSEILKALRDLDEPAKNATIAEHIGAHRGNTYSRLNDLCNQGLVTATMIKGVTYYSINKNNKL